MSKAKFLVVTLMVVVLSLMCLVNCMGVIRGSENLDTKTFDFSDFSRVEIGYAFEVEIVQSDVFSVSVTADDNLFEYILVEKNGDTLEIRLRSGYAYFATKRARITMPVLDSLSLSGASKGKVSGFSSSRSLKFDVSGASSLVIADVEAGDTRFEISGASHVLSIIKIAGGTFDVSGASTVELEGTADDVSMDVSGASTMRLADFAVTNADVELSGASNATINASGSLDIDLSGASRLDYIGNPTLRDISVSGGSTLGPR